MVICLCLLSLTIGLYFHRSIHGIYSQRAELSEFLNDSGHRAVAELDEVLLALAPAGFAESSTRYDLSGVRDLAARLRSLVEEAQSIVPASNSASGPVAAALGTIGRTEALDRLAFDLTAKTALTPDGLRRLTGELRATRTAYLLFLDEVSLVEERLVMQLQSRLGILTFWFWLFLAFSAFAGTVFLRLFRDEITQRLARERAERRADFLAYFDPLTGLGNRFQFEDRLADWIASQPHFAVLLVDIDRFCKFNGRHGRVSGDVVLKEIAFRLQSLAEKFGGYSARLAADDFALVVPEDNPERLLEISSQILRSCRAPVTRAGQTLSVSVSVGAAAYNGAGGREAWGHERLMNMATFALDSAKRKGGGVDELLDEDLARKFLDRKAVAEKLPRAIADGKLQVYLQPQFDIERGQVFGFEALVRWFIDGISVPPAELARISEEEGYIGDLDRFMLERAIRIVATWNRSHRSAFSVSVNFSALNMADETIVEFVETCLEGYSFDASLLTIEVTESIELDQQGKAADILQKLRSLGCKISIDDFGTGYSSLSYLRQIGIDEVKIDRSFVSDIEHSASAREFLQSILQLPKCLGHRVVVEGIETEQQRTLIERLGAQCIQGYLIGEPRPALEWLAATTYKRRTNSDVEAAVSRASA